MNMLMKSKFDHMLEGMLKDQSYLSRPYFQNLSNGKMSFEQFLSTQHQFYYAVVHFVCPLALVAAAVPTYEERVNIIKNLWEEHGEGTLKHTHGATFTEFL